MTRLKTTQDEVKAILRTIPETRDDDMKLYFHVCEACKPSVGSLRFAIVLIEYRTLGIPCFESVRRARQKLQATHPELAGSMRTKQLRKANEQAYRQYAKE